MKQQSFAAAAKRWLVRIGARFALFCLMAFPFAAGCVPMGEMFSEKKPPEAVINAETPVAYGVVSKVGAAEMAGKEVRTGDLAITVDLDSGGIIMIIQPEDDIYTVGDRVQIFRDGAGFARAQLL